MDCDEMRNRVINILILLTADEWRTVRLKSIVKINYKIFVFDLICYGNIISQKISDNYSKNA